MDLDVITPPLDGTILPGITRASVLDLCASHSPETPLPGIPSSVKLHVHERKLTMKELEKLSHEGLLVESFCVGTAVIVCAVNKIGYNGADIVFPKQSHGASISSALLQKITDIQTGKVDWKGWSVRTT